MIRKYRNEDLEVVLSIWFQASSISHSFLSDQELEEEKEKIKNIYIQVTDTWVYELENNVVGFISMCSNEIGGLFVLPSLHRKGIGTSLVDFVSKNYSTIEVEVFAKNTMGIKFYYRIGFRLMQRKTTKAFGNVLLRMELITNRNPKHNDLSFQEKSI